jgi:hypothetical protein
MLRKFFGLVILAATVALVGWADNWNKKTVLTVNEAIQVPGTILQPGTYVMKLVESLSDRHIVRIMNKEEDEVITTILAIPNYRLQPTGTSQFEFWETPAGNPRALRAWFYPGDNFGQEFAYPKGLSTKIAEYTQVSVPTTSTTKEVELPTAPVTEVDKSGTEKPLEAKVYTPHPAEPVAAAPAAPEPTPEPAPVAAIQQADRPALPETASSVPALGLAALLAIAAGFGLRRLGSAR